MKNICFCFQMHVPYRLKRYRFFDIGNDHYYYDDLATEELVQHVATTSYIPLCQTVKEMIKLSKGKFRCAFAVSGATIDLFRQFAPELIDLLQDLNQTDAVEWVAAPFAYSLASEYNKAEWTEQMNRHAQTIKELFNKQPAIIWNTEMLYSDDIAGYAQELGYKGVMTEGAKHIISWQSTGHLYASAVAPKMRVLVRNAQLSDELAFRFSDPTWTAFPMDAEKYADILQQQDEQEIINLWVGAETFGIRQTQATGIFDFLKALPYYVLEREMGFITPSDAIKRLTATETLSVPYPITWAGEAKDLSTFNGNDLQQEALTKLYAVAERVRLCPSKRLKADWINLQDISHLHYMGHQDSGISPYDSPYDAFINYMNVLSDFLQLVDEQYPSSIDNEELNSLLRTIANQEEEINRLKQQLSKTKKTKTK